MVIADVTLGKGIVKFKMFPTFLTLINDITIKRSTDKMYCVSVFCSGEGHGRTHHASSYNCYCLFHLFLCNLIEFNI